MINWEKSQSGGVSHILSTVNAIISSQMHKCLLIPLYRFTYVNMHKIYNVRHVNTWLIAADMNIKTVVYSPVHRPNIAHTRTWNKFTEKHPTEASSFLNSSYELHIFLYWSKLWKDPVSDTLSHEKFISTVVFHLWRLPLRQFACARKLSEYDVTIPVSYVRVTSQINCGDV